MTGLVQLLEAFLKRLFEMSAEERVQAARCGRFSRLERTIWSARDPAVPLVNDELPWIALASADLD